VHEITLADQAHAQGFVELHDRVVPTKESCYASEVTETVAGYPRSVRKPPREVVIAVVAVETVSAVLAYRDLAHRTAEQVRGPKRLWRIVMALNPGNSIAYWIFGRR
jgi:hypothetical protein